MSRREPKLRWYEEGQDPDYRFSLANERTFLAWVRTALAILAGAILLLQFATNLQPRWLLVALAAVLAGVTCVIGGTAYFRWRANEHAMRLSASLPRTRLLPMLAMVLVVLGLATIVLVVLS